MFKDNTNIIININIIIQNYENNQRGIRANLLGKF